MEQKNCLRMIYKLHSKELKKAKWKLRRPLEEAMKLYPDCIVSLNDSQAMRFIDDINGVENVNERVKAIQRKIRAIKKQPKSRETKRDISDCYKRLYELQFQRDYITVVMDSNADYDRANKGFSIDFGEVNGGQCVVHYRRFLGTNGGIKNSTIVYVNAAIYPELKKRLDNGRKKDVPLVPAKLEAYQALVCSGSTPLPQPKGFIVVNDCITHFKEDVIMISDEGEGEPKLTYVDDYEVEHNDSDGYGLMSPGYSRKVNEYFGGDSDKTVSGMNTRYAWTKGMVYTFDFVDFAAKVANGNYIIKDAWGDERDVRNADVILTVSMLKLWDSYDSWEDYYKNCQENGYQFSATKLTPNKLENVRNTNYQFLQSYEFSDDELEELCKPTIDEIKGVLGLDYRKSIVFLAGFGLNDNNVFSDNFDYCTKALMADPRLINDPYIRRKIYNMIKRRIEMGERGAIMINANFAMIAGDPYALCQSMFGLEVMGLLKAGELYHKYWIDKGSKELSCFRAPMSCHNNIKRLKLANTEEMQYWYQYITSAIVLNAWDTTCDALNGADKDGDLFMCTDNPIIVKNTLDSRTIMCIQRKAGKKIPTEGDIIEGNKLAFNDDIGSVTNRVTNMFEVQAGFNKDSDEYKTLAYRIMCGQLYQQNTIDRVKGIIANPMPPYWYTIRDNIVRDGDSEETAEKKKFNMKITAVNKPYFMIYVYPTLRRQLKDNNNNLTQRMRSEFHMFGFETIDDLVSYEPKTERMNDFIAFLEAHKTVGDNPCTVNRICKKFEREFGGYLSKGLSQPEFDYSILKSGDNTYSKREYDAVYKIYKSYLGKLDSLTKSMILDKHDRDYYYFESKKYRDIFKAQCEEVCPNERELCDIVLDICYGSEKTKQFAWDMCGETILGNVLNNNSYLIAYPRLCEADEVPEFVYCGHGFVMSRKRLDDECDYTE